MYQTKYYQEENERSRLLPPANKTFFNPNLKKRLDAIETNFKSSNPQGWQERSHLITKLTNEASEVDTYIMNGSNSRYFPHILSTKFKPESWTINRVGSLDGSKYQLNDLIRLQYLNIIHNQQVFGHLPQTITLMIDSVEEIKLLENWFEELHEHYKNPNIKTKVRFDETYHGKLLYPILYDFGLRVVGFQYDPEIVEIYTPILKDTGRVTSDSKGTLKVKLALL